MGSSRGERSKIAIIGAGISGMVSAYLLDRAHDITLFEAADRIGGHTSTIRIAHEGRELDVDTGFVVYNEVTYPNFVKLLDVLGVQTEPTSMSFSVRCERTGLEYCGTSLNTLFAQRRNLVRPAFYRMLRDIARFNMEATQLLEQGITAPTLREFFKVQRYGKEFIERYIVPMAAAIWSAGPERTLDFPAHFFIRFFRNHGLLGMTGHLQWRVISGGSQNYVEQLVRSFRDKIRTSTAIRSVRRLSGGVELIPAGGEPELYDEVVIATHSDQALAMLSDPTEGERRILSAIPYQTNEAALHSDSSMLPVNRRARASWNYRVPADPANRATVTYDMSRLQNLNTKVPVCVSLNDTDSIDPAKVVSIMEYSHPVFTPDSIKAQARHAEINGTNRTHYCGAYWGNGFHEDGVVSALRVCRRFGCELEA
jgi:predicted NAD/FAD-binding protein